MNEEEWEHQVKVAKWMFGGGIIGATILMGVFAWEIGVFLLCAECAMYGLYKLDALGALNI